jgi:tetratricopeptide (TPR) repeat protein
MQHPDEPHPSERLERLLGYLAHDPGNVALREDVVRTAMSAGRYDDALQALAGQSDAALPQARCLHHLERRAEAVNLLQRHLAVHDADAPARGLLALLLHEQGAGELARRHAQAALDADPGQPEALLALAGLQRDDGDTDRALATYRSLVDAEPANARGWHGVAVLELHALRVEAAAAAALRATELMPAHIGCWHVLGWIHLLKGEAAAARAAFERALALDRNFAETHGALAVAAALDGDDAQARAAGRRARGLDPDSLAAACAELVLHRRAGRDDEARRLLQRFLSRSVGAGGRSYLEAARELEGLLVARPEEPRHLH